MERVLQPTLGRLRHDAAAHDLESVLCSPTRSALIAATWLIRRAWADCIAATPPILLIFAFKIYIRRTSGQQFKYYNPTPHEAEQEHRMSFNEKRTRHSDMEKRFLHPALQADKLFTVMVHKSQEALARDILSAYPWFTANKHNKEGVLIKAVREDNLEYDPTRDGPRDEAHQAEWDARSVASTDMLGGKSELGGTPAVTPYGSEGYSQYPFSGDSSAFNSKANLPFDNPSTDHLLAPGSGYTLGPSRLGAHHPTRSTDSIAGAPLLQHAQDTGLGDVPYPPSAYTQPPVGYTPPTMRRTASGLSDEESAVGGQTRWDGGSDIGMRGGAPSYTTVPQYEDPYGGGYGRPSPGERDDPYGHYGGYGQPQPHRRQGSGPSGQ